MCVCVPVTGKEVDLVSGGSRLLFDEFEEFSGASAIWIDIRASDMNWLGKPRRNQGPRDRLMIGIGGGVGENAGRDGKTRGVFCEQRYPSGVRMLARALHPFSGSKVDAPPTLNDFMRADFSWEIMFGEEDGVEGIKTGEGFYLIPFHGVCESTNVEAKKSKIVVTRLFCLGGGGGARGATKA